MVASFFLYIPSRHKRERVVVKDSRVVSTHSTRVGGDEVSATQRVCHGHDVLLLDTLQVMFAEQSILARNTAARVV